MPACTACGRETRPEWKFCVWCGAPLDRSPADPAAEPARPDSDDATLGSRRSPEAQTRPIEPLAVIAVVLGVLCSPFALVFGHAAIVRIYRTRRRGRMAAIIGTVLGYGWTLLAVVIVVTLVLVPRG